MVGWWVGGLVSWCAGWMQGWTFQGGWWKCCFSRGPLTPLHPNIFEYISCVGVSCVLLGCIACCVLGASMMAGRLAGRQAGRLAGGGIWGGIPRTCQTRQTPEPARRKIPKKNREVRAPTFLCRKLFVRQVLGHRPNAQAWLLAATQFGTLTVL